MKGYGDAHKKKKNNNTKLSKEQIISQAINLHLKGNIREATKYYHQIIKIGWNDPRVFANYGIILRNLGKLKEAEILFRKAIKLNPSLANAHSNLGNLLRDLGNLKEAEISFHKAIELKPNFAEAHSNLGSVLSDLGKLKEAEIYHRKAIELNPSLANAHSYLGNLLRDLGNLKEAEIYQRKAIELQPNFVEAHCNLGIILSDLGNLKEAEILFRKAIKLKPNCAEAYCNLGNVFIDLGNLKEAETLFRKAIELQPNLVEAYYALSRIKYSDENKMWQELIFSENFLIKKSKKEQVIIYFTRANILHKEKKYNESSKYLKLANNLKLEINPSKPNNFIKKFKALFFECNKQEIPKKEDTNYCESIFIVGMPRSGSTLVESILSMRNDVYDLGESNFLDQSFMECKNSIQNTNLAEVYKKKVNNKTKLKITTDKDLYNFQYAGIIANQIPNAKIIHCFRNPLDNILSIYRAHFSSGYEYSSSLVDCARIYIEQEALMNEYKKKFKTIIYELNYDSLVTNPIQEIKSLISWLDWEWDDKHLSPHLNTRSVKTASNLQVRSPINPKSIGGWKNYKEMLQPAIEIFSKIDSYRDLI